MAKIHTDNSIGKSEKFDVAVQRPTVNVKEAENVMEQANAASAPLKQEPLVFSKHGTFGPSKGHALNDED